MKDMFIAENNNKKMSLYMDDSFIAENDYLTKLRLFQALK
jgi:hypothetical protein